MHTTPTKTASAPVIRMFDVTSKMTDQVKAKSEDNGLLLENAGGGLDTCVDPTLTDLALQVRSVRDHRFEVSKIYAVYLLVELS